MKLTEYNRLLKLSKQLNHPKPLEAQRIFDTLDGLKCMVDIEHYGFVKNDTLLMFYNPDVYYISYHESVQFIDFSIIKNLFSMNGLLPFDKTEEYRRGLDIGNVYYEGKYKLVNTFKDNQWI